MPLVFHMGVERIAARLRVESSDRNPEDPEPPPPGRRPPADEPTPPAPELSTLEFDAVHSALRALQFAQRCANEALSLVHLAHGLNEAVSERLARMRAIAARAADPSCPAPERRELGARFAATRAEIALLSATADPCGRRPLGTVEPLPFVIGGLADGGAILEVHAFDARPAALQIDRVEATTASTARAAVLAVDRALMAVGLARDRLTLSASRAVHALYALAQRIQRSLLEDGGPFFADPIASARFAPIAERAAEARAVQANLATRRALPLLC